MTLRITTETKQYSLRQPAHRYWQGGRCVYYFALDLETLDGLLPQRVDDAMIREANRQLTPSHARNIQEYLETEDHWLLGGMMLGVSESAVEFESYKDEHGTPNPNFGELRILTNRVNTMRIFDGQHRRRAIQDTLFELGDDEEQKERFTALRKASVPIVLYAEDNLQALRQMFVDASKTKRIEANTVARFDQRDPFNLAALHLEKESKLFGGRIEMERSTVAPGRGYLASISQLVALLRTTAVGYSGRVSQTRKQSYMYELSKLQDLCLAWADEFMPAAREEYGGLLTGEIENADIPDWRGRSLAFSITTMNIFAGCYHDWIAEGSDWKPLAEFIRGANLKSGGGSGALLVDAGVVAPGGTSPVGRRQEVAGAIRYILQRAKAEMG